MQTAPRRDFDKDSIQWDADHTRVQLAHAVVQAILGTGKISQSMNALDFGCGTGLLTLALQPHVKSITGVDSSAGMLDRLNEKIAANGLSNVSTQFVDFEHGKHIEGNYDLIVSSMTAHHVPDTLQLLREWHRVLKPGGRLLCRSGQRGRRIPRRQQRGRLPPGLRPRNARRALPPRGLLRHQRHDRHHRRQGNQRHVARIPHFPVECGQATALIGSLDPFHTILLLFIFLGFWRMVVTINH